MARRDIVHGAVTYTVADDDPAVADLLSWAVLRTRVVDELTQEPPRALVRLTSNAARATARVGPGGVCGLVARPRDVAGALTSPGGLEAAIAADGYLAHDLTAAIDAARRSLTLPAPTGATTIRVTPPDSPRQQFTPGRGVLLARPSAATAEEFTHVIDTGAVPLPSDVDIADAVETLRPVGSRLAGVPIVLPVQELHRAGSTVLRGRIQRRTGPSTLVPGAGASFGISGTWWTYPSSTTTAARPVDVCAIAPTTRGSHVVGAVVSHCTLTPGASCEVRAAAPAGATEITLAPNAGLNPAGGDLIRLGDPLTPEHEIAVSAGFTAPLDPVSPVRVRLTRPTASLHRAGDPARVVIAALTPFSTISRAAVAGDAVLFAAGLPALPATTSYVAVDDGTAGPAIYQATQLPFTPDGVTFTHQVPLDPDGRFEFPPMARLAQVRLVVSHPAHAVVQRDVALDYSGDTTVAIVLT